MFDDDDDDDGGGGGDSYCSLFTQKKLDGEENEFEITRNHH